MAKKRSRSGEDPELDEIRKAQRELEERIAQAQSVPEQIQLELEELESTIPAPDDLVERERARRFEEQATRGQVRNERRTQGRSLLLLFLLLAATAAVISYIVKILGN